MRHVSGTLGMRLHAVLPLHVSVQMTQPPGMLFGTGTLTRRYLPPGRYGEAEPLYRRALDICERMLGSHHSYVATSLGNLADLLMVQGAPLCAMRHINGTLGMCSHAVLPLHGTVQKPQCSELARRPDAACHQESMMKPSRCNAGHWTSTSACWVNAIPALPCR